MKSACGNPQGNHLRRLNTLTAMVCSAIKTGKSYLHSLGSELPQDIDSESRAKHVKRWLTNKYTDYSLSFLPFIGPALASYIAQDKEMVFAIDGSEAGQGCTVLMISLVIGKRAVPICWLVKKCKKGHLPAKMHLEVFTILHSLTRGYTNVVVLGDGEFDNGEVVTACNGWGWRFVFRTAKNTKIYDGEEEYPIGRLGPQANEKFFIVHDVAYAKDRYGPVNATVWTERNWDGPLYLLSNFELSYICAFYYRKRWSIETLFGDIKSRGFNIHKSKLADPERVAKLLIIICLAYILIFRLGEVEQNSPLLSKVTRKDRMDLSIFTIGKKLVDYCLKRAIEIVFSFSKNCFISTS
ncbi:MAG: transposase [Saprospiraceae bacterium]